MHPVRPSIGLSFLKVLGTRRASGGVVLESNLVLNRSSPILIEVVTRIQDVAALLETGYFRCHRIINIRVCALRSVSPSLVTMLSIREAKVDDLLQMQQTNLWYGAAILRGRMKIVPLGVSRRITT